MANITDLLSNVYDILARTFSSPNTYLQIGWPGISLSPADFKPFDNPLGGYDANCAEETFSWIGNIAPVCSALRFENSGFEIDDLYQILIYGAIPQGADPQNPTLTPAYKLFSDAQYEFEQAKRGSNQASDEFYHRCRAFPLDWYTEANAQNWPTLSLSSTQVKPAGSDSSFIKLGGNQLIEKGLLKLPPQNSDSIQIKNQLQTNLNSRLLKLDATKISTTPVVVKKPVNISRGQPLAVTGDAIIANKNVVAPNFRIRKLTNLNQLTIDTKKYDVVPTKGVTFNSRLVLRNLLAEQLTPVPVASTTNGFSISFKYCLVNIDRNWLNGTLLNMKNWYLMGTKIGEYAKGVLENNAGMFPMLPFAFVALRDLKLTANWSQSDVQNISQAKYFGPFDIRSGTFNQNAIEAKGLQVIAWLSRLNPPLPPLAAPV